MNKLKDVLYIIFSIFYVPGLLFIGCLLAELLKLLK